VEAEDLHPLLRFKIHVLRTNEIFLAVREVAASVVRRVL